MDTSEFEYGCPSICPCLIPSVLYYNASGAWLFVLNYKPTWPELRWANLGTQCTLHMQCILVNNIWNSNFAFKLISLMLDFSVFQKKVLIQSLISMSMYLVIYLFVCMYVLRTLLQLKLGLNIGNMFCDLEGEY